MNIQLTKANVIQILDGLTNEIFSQCFNEIKSDEYFLNDFLNNHLQDIKDNFKAHN